MPVAMRPAARAASKCHCLSEMKVTAPFGKRGVCLLAGLAFTLPAVADESAVALSVQCTGQSISVHATQAPVKRILAELAHACGLTVVLRDSMDERLSIDVRRMAPQRAVKSILRQYSFILRYTQPAPDTGNWLWVLANSTSPEQPGEIIRPARAEPAVDETETIYLLGEGADGQIADQLLDALGDPDRDVREAAAETFGELGTEAAALALTLALNDPDLRVRETAVDALGLIGGDVSTQLLQQLLADTNPVIREAAADNLAELLGPR